MNVGRLLISGALKPTRAVIRREGALLSAFALIGALAYGYLLALALVAAIEWVMS